MRWMWISVTALIVSVMPVAASAHADDQPVTAAEVASAFSSAGFQVQAPIEWGWLKPQVTTLVVRDTATGRWLTVFVFPDAASADLFRGQMAAHLQTAASDPHVLDGYGPSTWSGNVGMVQSTESHLTALAKAESAQRMGMYTVTDNAADLHAPDIHVDLDFQQALRNSVVNL